jgi:hypothetical protein
VDHPNLFAAHRVIDGELSPRAQRQRHARQRYRRWLRSRAGIYELARTKAIGYAADVQVVFNATQFTASGTMTWTVQAADVIAYRYTRLGSLVFLSFHIGGTDVTAPLSTTLYLPLPSGIVQPTVTPGVDLLQEQYCRILDNGVSTPGRCFVESPDSPRLAITRRDGANLTASASGTGVRGQMWFQAAP